ncbi:hypothetical protein ACWC5C_01270 [Streptomyces sp. NPDC001700]
MSFQEAVEAVSVWGEPKVFGPFAHTSLVDIDIVVNGIGFQVHLEEGEHVTSVELWWPGEGRETSTRVILDGEDVFQTPADEILRRAIARGWRVDDSNAESPLIPGVSLGFTRQTSQEVPRESSGLPVCFTSVLVGDENCYDFLYEGGS